MIVVKVELHSAITGEITQIARMHIANVGGDRDYGNYSCATFRGRDAAELARFTKQREGRVANHPRLREHVWNLVAHALRGMGYGFNPSTRSERADVPKSIKHRSNVVDA